MVENEEEDGEGEEGGVWDEGPTWLDLKHGCQQGPFALCTDLNTDCVPINYCMSVCETERQQGMEDRAKALLAHKSL